MLQAKGDTNLQPGFLSAKISVEDSSEASDVSACVNIFSELFLSTIILPRNTFVFLHWRDIAPAVAVFVGMTLTFLCFVGMTSTFPCFCRNDPDLNL